uniref:Golgi apparatus protein 1 n=1 Tax=Globodera rostochiensis TaxID=31243 RepID=A0A914H8J5_GLORO
MTRPSFSSRRLCRCTRVLLAVLLVGYVQRPVADAQAVPAAQSQPNVAQPPPQQQQQQPQAQQTANAADSQRLVQRTECRNDIRKHCSKLLAQLNPGEVLTDMDALDCLQDAGFSETESLEAKCAQAVWEYKIELTQDMRFIGALQQFCSAEISQNSQMKECTLDNRPGYALSCMMANVHLVDQASRCFQFLLRTERVAFSDFGLVAPFVEHCATAIMQLECGALTKPSLHANVRVPHSQGSTLECLISYLVNVPKDAYKAKVVEGISQECRKEVMRIAELQSDDWHLDRPLFFACRMDRERFCSELPAGEGKVFHCLMEHKQDPKMAPQCSKILSERAGLMGRDYKLAHPLLKSCDKEVQAYRCVPQPGFEKSLQFHLSWVVLCLENGLHYYKTQEHDRKKAEEDKTAKQRQWPNLVPFNDECQHEMLTHRQMMVQEFRMSPEIVMGCAQEIDKYCSPKGDIESEGKTVHCLMAHAQERDEKKVLTQQCKNALQELVKLADIGSNYKVDKVLFDSCKPVIEGKCKMDAVSEANTLSCLMRNLDEPEMTDECEQRLVEVQYFMARDWSLDPQLYESCHQEAVTRCGAVENWHEGVNKLPGQDQKVVVDPGPQVLACLYRSGYDEANPLSKECASNVRRVLRERAARVNLIPDIEENCRDALSEYCSQNIKPTEEMHCLQEHFEQKEFKDRYGRCYTEVERFTQMESRDTKLNRLLTRACRPVISTYCAQYQTQEIDHGDVMECLAAHKEADEMSTKCRSYVNHFELISLRDYHFSYRFTQACQDDIRTHCVQFGQDKGAIIRCLSNIVFEHRVLSEQKDLGKDCKKQLRVAYLQQEQFDDKEHMGDADPQLMKQCATDLQRYNCLAQQRFEDVVECLRINFDNLAPDCKALVFSREKIEALDNTFDDELQNSCKYDIGKYCGSQKGDKVLDCLMNTKIVRLLQKGCLKVVKERMLERVKDDRLNPSLLESCQKEAEQYCADDYKKINNPQYTQQQLGPIIATCLRTQFAKFTGGGMHLSMGCKDELSKLILESEFDIQLDPALYKACRRTINKHCANAIIARGGNYDTVLECLKADFYANQIPDRDCAQQLARRTQESLIDIHLDPGLHEACSVDIQRVCREVPPGQSRIIMCLVDAARNSQVHLSTSCRTKLTERNKLWQVAHDEYRMALPDTWSEAYAVLLNHPQRTSILTWLGIGLLVLLLAGCFLGRYSARAYKELKNR